MVNLEQTLAELIRNNERMMTALKAARQLELPDWFIGGGAIRNLVWDALHHYRVPTPLNDIDVIYFDPTCLTPEQDVHWEQKLFQQNPWIPWQVKNQAAVHLWYESKFGTAVEPLCSSFDAVSTWPETATSVAVRLLDNDDLWIIAPCGLNDLFDLILRRNPQRVSESWFFRRMVEKRIFQRWPLVKLAVWEEAEAPPIVVDWMRLGDDHWETDQRETKNGTSFAPINLA